MQPAIRCVNVSKRYNLGLTRTSLPALISTTFRRSLGRAPRRSTEDNYFLALKDVSFELEQGQSLRIIGPNGAGKSTILKLLANITTPTSGRISVDGRLSALIELGTGFHPDLTGQENIYLNGTILGLSRHEIKNRFDEIVAFSEIEPFIDTPVKRYSSGMLVRLGFSIAACIEPDILLVDEVLAVGDASFRQKCIKRIQSLLNNGMSVIFVSHNLVMVQAVCSSTLYIKHGKIDFHGNTGDTIARYEQDFHEERAKTFKKNSQTDQSEVEIAVKITKIEIMDAKGSSINKFRSDQSAEILVHYNAYQSISVVNAVISVIRNDGLTCCRMRTSIDNEQFSLQKGDGAFSVFIEPLQLNSGKYNINASIRTEMDLVLLATRKSNWFYVSGAPDSQSELSGVFEPNRRWVLHQPDGLHISGLNDLDDPMPTIIDD